ncbi:MAG TPA: hypothetical protein VFG04_13510 [Planctomycetaceae bacterium]|jgi:hypothetical protein|nr:hypothetical protein [Planctomycetaceae bacterium]
MAKRKKAPKRATAAKQPTKPAKGKQPSPAKQRASRKKTSKKEPQRDSTITMSVPLTWQTKSQKELRAIVKSTLGQNPLLDISHVIIEASADGLCTGGGFWIWDKFC